MKSAQQPRALRKPFVAAIVITDMLSERQMSTRTSNLSLHGCFVPTPTPLNPGVKVQITIVYAGAKVVAFGRVVSARAEGMGIVFTKIEQRDQAVLERWIGELRVN
ncbi:MAG: PilZ domain-containing protein [Candidatus Acidiferrales bacterium]